MASRREVIKPGPIDGSLLTRQAQHISQQVWNVDENRLLRPRRCCHVADGRPPPAIVPLLIRAGFYGVSRVGTFQYNQGLISALVERWRPETHTFHFPQGECTIILQDVAMQLGLRCDGLVVTGYTNFNYKLLCRELLGVVPSDHVLAGQRVSMLWLSDQFNVTPHANAPQMYLEQYARAYILRLIGGYLMPDKTSTHCCLMYLNMLRDFDACGAYSWGSAVLSYLYRELCKATKPDTQDIGGCLSLLHLWAWDRFPKLAPSMPPP
ncbi:serine/threonine-protein phosphatase 7 long form-like protein [Senna tora]|uniref:Serine/threonine-protein phosphatase 7 long form-like protein n=1 Tax=Senna tora TaxID=362788 RepID=A0A834TJI9_9FABA|nr:serine/threonine-protein phosphatase 7 long form-like protein [Senna tora]